MHALTRSLAKRALKNGEVTLNGEPIKQAATHIDTAQDEVRLNGERLELVGLRYIMLHKPKDVECTARRGVYPRVIDIIDEPKVERLQPVGRPTSARAAHAKRPRPRRVAAPTAALERPAG